MEDLKSSILQMAKGAIQERVDYEVSRVIDRWSNKDDLVFDPFAGLGTVPMMAVRKGRKGYGCELTSGYFADAVGYMRAETTEIEQPSLFDLIESDSLR